MFRDRAAPIVPALLLLGFAWPIAASGASKLYWNDNELRALYRCNPDGSGVEVILPEMPFPWEMGLDGVAGKIYWLSRHDGSSVVRRAGTEGSNPEIVLTFAPTIDVTQGFAVDPRAGLMFWGRYRTPSIQRANLDGTAIETILSWSHAGPGDLALDPIRQHVYWGDWTSREIFRARYDGSGAELLVTIAGHIPFSLDLDLVRGHIYWTNSSPGDDLIMRTNLDGSDPVEIARGVRVNDLEVDAEGGWLYIVQKSEGRLMRMSLDGTASEVILSGLPDPWHAVLSFEGPVPVTPSSWGKVKARYRSGRD